MISERWETHAVIGIVSDEPEDREPRMAKRNLDSLNDMAMDTCPPGEAGGRG